MTPEIQAIDQSQDVTRAMVVAAVESIRAIAGDDEAAHAAEDRLHRAVLLAISKHRIALFDSAAELAAAALRTSEIEFERWCA